MASWAIVVAMIALGAAGGCSTENALVGGECAPGYMACRGECATSCDGVLADGAVDRDGGDGVGDADPDDPDARGRRDGSRHEAGDGDGALPDGGDGALPDGGDGGLVCAPPTVLCNGKCITVDSDPQNCGACGKFCPSNICVAGKCEGEAPGNVVVIGHDYQQAVVGSAQARVLSNSVFIGRSNPLRILSYEQYAESATVTNIKNILQSASLGRTLQYTVATTPTPLASPTLDAAYDVVLIYDQQGAAPGALATIGASWAPHLQTFAKAGGVVVALDGAGGQEGMPSLITSAGLLDLPTHKKENRLNVLVVEPADRVATLVQSPYGAFERSVTLQPTTPNGGNVVYVARKQLGAGATGDPVVIHRVVPQ